MSKKIMLVIGTLNSGGAERIISLLANTLEKRGYQVILTTTDASKNKDFYPLNPNITRIKSNITSESGIRGLRNSLKRIYFIRKAIIQHSPDEVISFLSINNIFVLLASLGLKTKPIVAERSDPTHISKSKYINYAWLRKKLYPRAKMVVIQTQRGIEKFYKYCGYKGDNCIAIANPVANELIDIPYQYNEESKNIIAMGRLVDNKGFDLLIKAFSKLPEQHSDWTLTIWGEGIKRNELEALVKTLNLNNKILLPGKTNAAWEKMAQSAFLVLSSREEGIPNVMLESMTIGTPVVATDCDTGPRELSQHGEDAILVPVENVEALSDAMTTMIESPDLRKSLSKKGLSVRERYSLETIIDQWADLFS